MSNQVRLEDTDGGKWTPDAPGSASWSELPEDLAPDVTALIDAIERLQARPRRQRTPDELRATLIRLRYAADLLELEFAAVAADFAATDEAAWCGSASPVDWIRHECRMSGSAASSAVAVGAMAAELPDSTAAVRQGRIGFAHLALLAGTARALQLSPSAGGGFDETTLLEQARAHSVGRFRHDCAHARHAADAAAVLAEHVDAVACRRLELMPCGNGAVALRGLLDAVGGATLRTALEPLARRTGAGDSRLRERRLADALIELAGHCLDRGSLPSRGGQRPHLQVTTTLETLLGHAGVPAGELDFSMPIPAATVQRLACDSSVVRILLGPDSAVIDVGRSLRVPPPATRRALSARDRGCTWPGCDRPATWCVAHHLTHWAHLGVTDLANLTLLCYRHHWLVHEGGWQLIRTDGGQLLTVPPLQGRRHQARAPDSTAVA